VEGSGDGSEREQQGASGKYGMKVGNVLDGRGSDDESALDGAEREEWHTWVLEDTALVRKGERLGI
jgi:hypothetical protein